MAQSTLSAARRKASQAKPKKPNKDFPLWPHPSGRWCKKIKGKFLYFGKVDDDPQGQAALDKWLDQKDDLLAGRKPREASDSLTIKDLCNRFLTSKQRQLDSGEITQRTFQDYKFTTDRLITRFGKSRVVEDIAADDFELLRADIAKTRAAVALGNEIQRIRTIFKYAFENALIEKPIRYGTAFKKPSKKVLRVARAGNGKRMFEAAEVRSLIDSANVQLKAMILLGVNCGFGNSDCAGLPVAAIDLGGGWIDFARPKTGIERKCPLWPETVEALRAAIETRPQPTDEGDNGLAFITKYGSRWVADYDNAISKETRKLLDGINTYHCKECNTDVLLRPKEKDNNCSQCDKKLGEPKSKGLHRRGLGFYAFRHTFRTVSDATRDFPAVNHIMGHSDDTMGAVYREQIGDDRLRAVVDHVHDWLYGKPEDEADSDVTEGGDDE
jgi:integrase